MREPKVYGKLENLKKYNILQKEMSVGEFKATNLVTDTPSTTIVDAFLKKEIEAIKKEATVIPVLSNANSAK